MMKLSILPLAVAGLALAGTATVMPARAEVGVKAGVLTCHVDSGWGFVFGSSRQLRCTFTGGGRVEHYSGDISKFGVDVGYVQSGVIVWGVFVPTDSLKAGDLGGDYGGATGGASLGLGGDANVLIGGSTKSISLQPLSLEGDKGFNIAAGIAAVSLSYQPQ